MKIEILKNNRPLKVKKTKITKPELIDIDFTSINKLRGNKTVLDYSFFIVKQELLKD